MSIGEWELGKEGQERGRELAKLSDLVVRRLQGGILV